MTYRAYQVRIFAPQAEKGDEAYMDFSCYDTHAEDAHKCFTRATFQLPLALSVVLMEAVSEDRIVGANFANQDWQVVRQWSRPFGELPRTEQYIAVTQAGTQLFEGSLDQFDDSFGIAAGCTEAQALAFANSENWTLARIVG